VTRSPLPARTGVKKKGYFHAEKCNSLLTTQRRALSSIGDENAAGVQDEDDICAVRGD
jgi:hypothetical protein